MTRPEAISTAQGAATRFGKPFVVYRLPAWPPTVFGVVAEDRGLPPEASVIERLGAELARRNLGPPRELVLTTLSGLDVADAGNRWLPQSPSTWCTPTRSNEKE